MLESPEKFPTVGLGLALDEGLRTQAFKLSNPLFRPFIKPFSDRWDRFTVLSTRHPHSQIDAVGPMFALKGPEPDVRLTVLQTLQVTMGHVNALTKLLEAKLPNLQIHMPEEVKQYAIYSPLPSDITITISRNSLIHALAACEDECFKKPFEKLQNWVRLCQHAQSASNDDKLGYDQLSYMAASIANENFSDNPFFPTSKIPNLYKRDFDGDCLTDFIPGIEASLAASRIQDSNSGDMIVQHLNNIGLSHLSFVTYGTRSHVFRSITDIQSHARLILFSPASDPLPESPFHLPAYKLIACDDIYIRNMPELPKEGAHEAAEELQAILERHDLSTLDVSQYNVGYYSYTDSEGVNKRVPMIFDWNAGPVELTDGEKNNLETSLDIEPWRAACAHIEKQNHLATFSR